MTAILIAAAVPVSALSIDRLPSLYGRVASITVSKPGQLALAPTGDRVAVSDRFANRILILDSRGTLIWSVGDGLTLNQPSAVLLKDGSTVVFAERDSRQILSVSEDTPQEVDTVAEISPRGAHSRINRIYCLADGSHAVLWENPDQLLLYSADWSSPREIVKEGPGKGKLDRPVACALLPAGRIAVAGGGHFPVQLFDLSGRLLTVVDWNSPTPRSGWVASAVTVDQQERIWVADLTNSVFRQYDLTGTPIVEIAFSSPLLKPFDMAVTSDNQLFVLTDSGRLEIHDLSQE